MEIMLSNGILVEVDDEDYTLFDHWVWKLSNSGYACRSTRSGGIFLHIEIWKEHYGKIPEDKEIDHKDRNRLNCKKENLRLATSSENKTNEDMRRNNTSGYKGVSFHKASNNWRADIMIKGKRVSLGYFKDINEAALAYNKAAKQYFGEFAYQNDLS